MCSILASGEPLPVFLATAVPETPRAAVIWSAGPVHLATPFLDAIPSLRCVVSTSATVHNIDLHECARRGVIIANAGRIYSTAVADHAVGMLIDVFKRVSAAERFVRRGLWSVRGTTLSAPSDRNKSLYLVFVGVVFLSILNCF
jgi:glyoxylate/hydroxypyruvate reductase